MTTIMIHTADQYGATKDLDNSKEWSNLINEEFKQQNAEEMKRGLPETPFYKNQDNLAVVARSEKFFVDKILSPLWNEWDRFLNGALVVQKKNIAISLKHWEEVCEEEETKAKQKK